MLTVGSRIGAAETDPERLPPDLKGNVLAPIFDLLRAADVVVDTSASPEVHLTLSPYCRQFRVTRRVNAPLMLIVAGSGLE